jgi:hypothetical protein
MVSTTLLVFVFGCVLFSKFDIIKITVFLRLVLLPSTGKITKRDIV